MSTPIDDELISEIMPIFAGLRGDDDDLAGESITKFRKYLSRTSSLRRLQIAFESFPDLATHLWHLWETCHRSNNFKVSVSLMLLMSQIFSICKTESAASELSQLMAFADSLNRTLVHKRLKNIYAHLSCVVKGRTNSALILLITIVLRGKSAARDLLATFDFTLPALSKVSRHQDPFKRTKADWASGKEGSKKKSAAKSLVSIWQPQHGVSCVDASRMCMRSLFVELCLSFLDTADQSLMRTVLAKKPLFSNLFQELSRDRPPLIQRVLATFQSKVMAANANVPRGLQAAVLGESALEQIVKISLPSFMTGSNASSSGVASAMANGFLAQLCTNPSHGICPVRMERKDVGKATSARLIKLLSYLRVTDARSHSDILLQTASKHPSMAAAYLSSIPFSLEPRPSDSWFAGMTLVGQVVTAASTAPPPVEGVEEGAFFQTVLPSVFPPALTKALLGRGLQHRNFLVKYVCLCTLLDCMGALHLYLEHWTAGAGPPSREPLLDLLRPLLPDPQVILALFKKVEKEGGKRRASLAESGGKRLKVSGDVALKQQGGGAEEDDGALEMMADDDGQKRTVSDLIQSKALLALGLYQRTVPEMMTVYDPLKLLPQSPLTLPASHQKALLTLLKSFTATAGEPGGPAASWHSKSPLHRQLVPLIHLLKGSKGRLVQGMSSHLVWTALLTVEGLGGDGTEVWHWIEALPALHLPGSFTEADVEASWQDAVIRFFSNAVRSFAGNSTKFSLKLQEAMEGQQMDASHLDCGPLFVCVLDSCLRLLRVESAATGVASKAAIAAFTAASLLSLTFSQKHPAALASAVISILQSQGSDLPLPQQLEWNPIRRLLDSLSAYCATTATAQQSAADMSASALDKILAGRDASQLPMVLVADSHLISSKFPAILGQATGSILPSLLWLHRTSPQVADALQQMVAGVAHMWRQLPLSIALPLAVSTGCSDRLEVNQMIAFTEESSQVQEAWCLQMSNIARCRTVLSCIQHLVEQGFTSRQLSPLFHLLESFCTSPAVFSDVFDHSTLRDTLASSLSSLQPLRIKTMKLLLRLLSRQLTFPMESSPIFQVYTRNIIARLESSLASKNDPSLTLLDATSMADEFMNSPFLHDSARLDEDTAASPGLDVAVGILFSKHLGFQNVLSLLLHILPSIHSSSKWTAAIFVQLSIALFDHILTGKKINFGPTTNGELEAVYLALADRLVCDSADKDADVAVTAALDSSACLEALFLDSCADFFSPVVPEHPVPNFAAKTPPSLVNIFISEPTEKRGRVLAILARSDSRHGCQLATEFTEKCRESKVGGEKQKLRFPASYRVHLLFPALTSLLQTAGSPWLPTEVKELMSSCLWASLNVLVDSSLPSAHRKVALDLLQQCLSSQVLKVKTARLALKLLLPDNDWLGDHADLAAVSLRAMAAFEVLSSVALKLKEKKEKKKRKKKEMAAEAAMAEILPLLSQFLDSLVHALVQLYTTGQQDDGGNCEATLLSLLLSAVKEHRFGLSLTGEDILRLTESLLASTLEHRFGSFQAMAAAKNLLSLLLSKLERNSAAAGPDAGMAASLSSVLPSAAQAGHRLFQMAVTHPQFHPLLLPASSNPLKPFSASASRLFPRDSSPTSLPSLLALLDSPILPQVEAMSTTSRVKQKQNQEEEEEQREGGDAVTETVGLLLLLLRLRNAHLAGQEVSSTAADIPLQDVMSILLAGYGATRGDRDSAILALLHDIEACGGIGFPGLSGADYIWGEGALRRMSGKQHSSSHGESNSMAVITSPEDILESMRLKYREDLGVDARRCGLTAICLLLDSSSSDQSHGCMQRLVSEPGSSLWVERGLLQEAYDIDFLLPLMGHVLAKDMVDLRDFVQQGFLAIALLCLCNGREDIRRKGYHIVGLYTTRITACDSLKERHQLQLLLRYVKNAVHTPLLQLPAISALFAAECACILSHPESHFFTLLNRTLLKRPALDLEDIPMFYSMFMSGNPQFHRLERLWMLKELSLGLCTTTDALLFRRRFVPEMAMGFWCCHLADSHSRKWVLMLLRRGVCMEGCALDWVRNAGLIPWLSQALLDCLASRVGSSAMAPEADNRKGNFHMALSLLETLHLLLSWPRVQRHLARAGHTDLQVCFTHLKNMCLSQGLQGSRFRHLAPRALSLLALVLAMAAAPTKGQLLSESMFFSLDDMCHLISKLVDASYLPASRSALLVLLRTNPLWLRPKAFTASRARMFFGIILWALQTALMLPHDDSLEREPWLTVQLGSSGRNPAQDSGDCCLHGLTLAWVASAVNGKDFSTLLAAEDSRAAMAADKPAKPVSESDSESELDSEMESEMDGDEVSDFVDAGLWESLQPCESSEWNIGDAAGPENVRSLGKVVASLWRLTNSGKKIRNEGLLQCMEDISWLQK